MSSETKSERFFSLDGLRLNGECGYDASWPGKADATPAELMFLVTVCDVLAAQFREEVIERIGEERAYYLEEYQKASLKDFTAKYMAGLALAAQKEAVQEKQQLDEALALIRRHNPQFNPTDPE
jgi:hypothetical protein